MVIGNFDGVHLGHCTMVHSAVQEAQKNGLAPLVLTFYPHPAEVLGRGKQEVLTPLDYKIELLGRAAPELRVVVERFTRELAGKSPRQFAEELLVGELGAGVVIVGDNFRFGKGRAGDVSTLVALGKELGFVAHTHALEGDAEGPYSSSRVRDAVRSGDLPTATRILGRPHALSGGVVRGDGRGRTIGIPTANIAPVPELLPPFGVYACVVDDITDPAAPRALAPAVTNIGQRPTFDASFSVETHLLDWDGNHDHDGNRDHDGDRDRDRAGNRDGNHDHDGNRDHAGNRDLYDKRLRVHLVARLRDERKFPNKDALVAQIQQDIAQARPLLAPLSPKTPTWF